MSSVIAILVVISALAGALYVLWRPQWAVLVILVMFPLEQLFQVYVPFMAANPWFMNVAVAVLAGLAVVSRVLKGEPLLVGVFNPVSILMLVLYVWTWAATTWSPNPVALPQMAKGVPYVLLGLGLTPLLLTDLHDIRRISKGLLVVGTFVAIFILANPASGFALGRLTIDVGPVAGIKRTNPLALATMGGTVALVATLIRFERATPLTQVLRAGAFIFGLGLAIASGSRGQVLGVAFVGVLMYPLARKVASVRNFFLTAGGLMVLAAGLYLVFSIFVTDVNRDRWDTQALTRDVLGRWEMVEELANAYAAEPSRWIVGLGTSAYAVTGAFQGTYVHNVLVEILCELGVVGAAIMALIMLHSYRMGRWLFERHREDPTMRSMVAILGAMWLYTLVISLKQGSWCNNPAAFMWWLVLARVAAYEIRSYNQAVLWGEEPDATDEASLDAYEDDELAWAR